MAADIVPFMSTIFKMQLENTTRHICNSGVQTPLLTSPPFWPSTMLTLPGPFPAAFWQLVYTAHSERQSFNVQAKFNTFYIKRERNYITRIHFEPRKLVHYRTRLCFDYKLVFCAALHMVHVWPLHCIVRLDRSILLCMSVCLLLCYLTCLTITFV